MERPDDTTLGVLAVLVIAGIMSYLGELSGSTLRYVLLFAIGWFTKGSKDNVKKRVK